MKKLFLLLFAALIFQNSNCNKCTVAALPDLFAKAIEITQKPGGFTVGDIATVALSIQNLIDLTSNCTDVAGATEYETNLYHRANASSAWTNVGKATYSQPAIDAGGNGFSDNPRVSFNVAGDYYVGDITNAVKKIQERNFNNNNANSQSQLGVRSIGATSIGFITVKSTKEFEDKVKRGETIPYVTFEPKSNLLKVEVKNFN